MLYDESLVIDIPVKLEPSPYSVSKYPFANLTVLEPISIALSEVGIKSPSFSEIKTPLLNLLRSCISFDSLCLICIWPLAVFMPIYAFWNCNRPFPNTLTSSVHILCHAFCSVPKVLELSLSGTILLLTEVKSVVGAAAQVRPPVLPDCAVNT